MAKSATSSKSTGTQAANTPSLIETIDSTLKMVRTQSLDISFNELADMYTKQELRIDPDYQRTFQWSGGKQSRFIETLILEMPVPPIFVVEEEDGKYELIDGLQRISSYLHFRGILDMPHHEPPIKRGACLALHDCDIVTELNGKTYDDLGTAIQIRLKRHFIRVEVVRKESDKKFKYYMFKRLNTGGENLSEQQIRNCTIKLLDDTFNKFIIDLSKNADFKKCTLYITPKQRSQFFDQELVLRFFAQKNDLKNFVHDIADFLTEYMENVSDPLNKEYVFDFEQDRSVFEKTFRLLSRTLGEYSFSYPNKTSDKMVKAFSALQYEVFTLGIQSKLDSIDLDNATRVKELKTIFQGVKEDPAFIKLAMGGGKNSAGQLRARVKFLSDKIKRI